MVIRSLIQRYNGQGKGVGEGVRASAHMHNVRDGSSIEIATVLARNAKLSIFDEPEAGIDLWSFSKLVETFQELQKSHHGTLLIISHQERILSIADEIVVIADGVVREAGPREEVLPHLMRGESMGCMCPLGKEVRRA